MIWEMVKQDLLKPMSKLTNWLLAESMNSLGLGFLSVSSSLTCVTGVIIWVSLQWWNEVEEDVTAKDKEYM